MQYKIQYWIQYWNLCNNKVFLEFHKGIAPSLVKPNRTPSFSMFIVHWTKLPFWSFKPALIIYRAVVIGGAERALAPLEFEVSEKRIDLKTKWQL